MKISRSTLAEAVKKGILNNNQADKLYAFLLHQPNPKSELNLTQTLYYFGGLVAIAAMTIFMNLGWKTYGDWALFSLALIYVLLGLCLAGWFQKKSHRVPAGICATFVICLIPVAIYSIQRLLGWWPENAYPKELEHLWLWLQIEGISFILGALLFWFYRHPFMLMPIAISLWFFTLDLTAMLNAQQPISSIFAARISIYYGLAMIILAITVDLGLRSKRYDYAFWLYFFGILAFWGGLSMQNYGTEWTRFLYFLTNLLMILIGILLQRKLFVVFAGLGCFGYLSYLSFQLFENSLLFPAALASIGLLMIYLGVLWQKNEARLTQKLVAFLPKKLTTLLKKHSL